MPQLSPPFRRPALILLLAAYLWGVLPLTFGLGTHLEETAGLLTVQPDRLADAQVPVASGGLHASRWMPVWTWRRGPADALPLMVDGHIGGLPFWPYRALTQTWGLLAARLVGVATGVLLLVGMIRAGALLGWAAAGWVAAWVAATSPQFALMLHWARPDEQFSFGLPLAIGLALHRWHQTAHLRWWWLSALCTGLLMAAKSTGVWTVFVAVTAMVAFRLEPRVRLRDYVGAALVAALPLLPHLAFIWFGRDARALDVRFASMPLVAEVWTRARLAFFAGHFATSFGGAGSYLSAYFHGHHPAAAAWPAVLAAALPGAAIVVCGLLALSRRVAPAVRAFGFGLLALTLLYTTLYYLAMSMFGLLTVWVPLATGVALAWGWQQAGEGGLTRWRRMLRVALAAALLATCGHGCLELSRLHAAVRTPQTFTFSRQLQQQVATDLEQAGVARPWTMTYNIVGVLEVLSRGHVRPRHAFESYVLAVDEDTEGAYARAWRKVLTQMQQRGATHDLLLEVAAGPLDVSPLRHPEWMPTQLIPAAQRVGARLETVRTWRTAQGVPVLQWVKVRWPAQAAAVVQGVGPAPLNQPARGVP